MIAIVKIILMLIMSTIKFKISINFFRLEHINTIEKSQNNKEGYSMKNSNGFGI